MSQSAHLESILNDHGPFLRRLAQALVSDSHLAEDLVQDTWQAALRSPERIPGGPGGEGPVGSTRAWLATVLRFQAASHFRKSRGMKPSEVPAELPGTGPGAAEMTERLERDGIVHGALKAMKEPYRTTLVLRFHDGLTSKKIAERLGVPESTVRSQVARGLENMRLSFDTAYGDTEDPRAAWLAAFAPLLRPSGVHSGAAVASTTSAGGMLLGMKAATLTLALFGLIGVAGTWFLWVQRPIDHPTDTPDMVSAATIPAQESAAKSASLPSVQSGGATDSLGRVAIGDEKASLPLTSSVGVITGVLSLGDGTPLVDRTIRALATAEDGSQTGSPYSVSTTATGSFAFTDLPAGTYELQVRTTLQMERASFKDIPAGTQDLKLGLDAILVQAVLPEGLRGPAEERSLSVEELPLQGEDPRSVGIMNFEPDSKGGTTLLLPRGPGYRLTYDSRVHERHGVFIGAGLPSGTYEERLTDVHPLMGTVNVVLRGELVPEASLVGVRLDPLDAPELDHEFIRVDAPARACRNGFVAPGRYRVSTSLRQQLLEGWLIASADQEIVTIEAGRAVTIDVLVEPAGALKLLLDEDPNGPVAATRYEALRAEVFDPEVETWRPLPLSRITDETIPGRPQATTAGPLLPGEARYNLAPLPVGPLRVRLLGKGWRTSEEALEIRPGERILWTARPDPDSQ